MKILAVENYPESPLGTVGTALREQAADIDVIEAYKGDPLPDTPNGYDGLVILGGAQNALADDDYPYLPALAGLTRDFGQSGRAVLGICLGSQIIARAYGGDNLLDRPVEFGFRAVSPRPEAADDPVLSALEAPRLTFHWHKDTVGLPDGAVHLASSEMTPNQAWRIGGNVYAMQFHFEASREVVAHWSRVAGEHITPHTPDWHDRLDRELATNGAEAEFFGLDLARRWVRHVGRN